MLYKLKVKAVENLKTKDKPYKVSDGGGLNLLLSKAGSKTWVYAYRFQGIQKTLTIGNFPGISLKEAREIHQKAREALNSGVDPGAKKTAAEEEPPLTFGALAEGFFKELSSRVKASSIEQTRRPLDLYLLPALEGEDAARIRPFDISSILEGLKAKGLYNTARRALALTRRIVNYGFSLGLADKGLNDFTRGLDVKTPPPSGYSFLSDPAELGKLLLAIDDYSGRSPFIGKALKLLPLVFVRPGELASAAWEDVDLQAGLWTIPGDKMKMGRTHLVPLSRQAADIFSELLPKSGCGEYVFPAVKKPGQHIHKTSLTDALRHAGYTSAQQTPHGFRKTASTLLNERGYNYDWIERQLAHIDGGKVRGLYNKALYLDGRREMMQWWADYLDSLKEEALKR
ncbi:MAG: tyrosine-type recombinase/integrase [Deltaproteobacteria bacterium]|jgi:integrase|nr:tyrosine-type recombinase/integrase [Deltaproteobacteria bacterium]